MPPKRETKAALKQQVEDLKEQLREAKEAADPSHELERARESEKKLKRELQLMKERAKEAEQELTAAMAELSLAYDRVEGRERGDDEVETDEDETYEDEDGGKTTTARGDSSRGAYSGSRGRQDWR